MADPTLVQDHSLSGGPECRKVHAESVPAVRSSMSLDGVVESPRYGQPRFPKESVPPECIFNNPHGPATGLAFIGLCTVDAESVPSNEYVAFSGLETFTECLHPFWDVMPQGKFKAHGMDIMGKQVSSLPGVQLNTGTLLKAANCCLKA